MLHLATGQRRHWGCPCTAWQLLRPHQASSGVTQQYQMRAVLHRPAVHGIGHHCGAAASMQLHRPLKPASSCPVFALRLSDTGLLGLWQRVEKPMYCDPQTLPRLPATRLDLLLSTIWTNAACAHADSWKDQHHRLQSEAGAGTGADAAAAPAHNSVAEGSLADIRSTVGCSGRCCCPGWQVEGL